MKVYIDGKILEHAGIEKIQIIPLSDERNIRVVIYFDGYRLIKECLTCEVEDEINVQKIVEHSYDDSDDFADWEKG